MFEPGFAEKDITAAPECCPSVVGEHESPGLPVDADLESDHTDRFGAVTEDNPVGSIPHD